MRALTFTRYAKSGNLEFAEVARPAPKPHEILVKVHAVGLNPVDFIIPKGTFKPFLKFNLPATIGSDLAGVVVDVGNQVTRFKVGDAVFASTFDSGVGTLAEYAVVSESAAALKPARLNFVQAGSIPMVGLTSWQSLKERAGIKPGHKVFIPAGSGGIGTFAIQLAKHLGAKVGSTTSTANVDLVRSLGADEVIDYKTQDFETVLRDYDAVLGTVKDSLEKSLRILKPGSTVVSLVGPPDAAFARKRGMNFVFKLIFGALSRKIIRLARKRGSTYSFLFGRPDGNQLAKIGALLEAERIKPVIDRTFPFEQAKEALAYLEQGRARGKVVVTLLEDERSKA
jgi:NADPH:quinone reductase-like Zn-dependent oxidoreductase